MKPARAVIATLLGVLLLAMATPAATPAAMAEGSASGEVVVSWNAIAQRTIFTEALAPPHVGQLYLGFASSAVYDAVRRTEHSKASVNAAVATAAHDVLAEYFPASAQPLATDLAASLAAIPAGTRKDRGIRIGAAAAARLIADRVGDGRNAPITFDVPPGIGIWRPTPPANAPFLAPWLGFVKPLLLKSPTQVRLPGPDALTSRRYADDFAEVKAMGSATSTDRTAAQTENALFFSANAVIQYNAGMRDLATRKAYSARRAATMFGAVNMTSADAMIACWRSKYDYPFWRPITAIHEAADDGNRRTTADPAWMPLLPTPPYPDYTSGHACFTGSVASGLARLAGSDRIDLYVSSSAVPNVVRHYTSAAKLIDDTRNARIWLGFHFRTAMEDGTLLGRKVARIGFAELGLR